MSRAVDGKLGTALAALSKALDATGIAWMCIGGIAVIAQGVRRTTTDIDVTLRAEGVDLEALVRRLARHGIRPRIPDAVAFARRTQGLLLTHTRSGVDLDVSLAWLSFEHEALAAPATIDFAGVTVPAARPEDLVIYKLFAGRPQDLQSKQVAGEKRTAWAHRGLVRGGGAGAVVVRSMRPTPLLLVLALPACAGPIAPTPRSPVAQGQLPAGAISLVATPVPLPGATGAVSLDYLAVDRAAGRVWIPAGETGSIDVLDTASGKVTRVEGFATTEKGARGEARVLGPSSAAIGDGFVYVGNRGSSEVCAVDAARLVKGACVVLPTPPDGLQYVAATKEVWATTPRDRSITVLDASAPSTLVLATKVALDGSPEGYAVDDARGVFYTNLKDADKTVVLDAKAHRVSAIWEPHCGGDGPRGLALDAEKGLLFVACTNRVKVLDATHGGAQLAEFPAGDGIDGIDYLDTSRQLYIAAGTTGALTVLHVDEKGALSVIATEATAPGARVVVAGKDGSAYVADGKQGRVIAFRPAR